MLGACIGAAAGGLFGGFFQMKCFGIATPAIVTIVQYVEKGKPQSLLFAALTILLTIVVAFIATMIIGFEDVVDENDDELDMLETESKEEVKVMENAIDIASPAEGKQFHCQKLQMQHLHRKFLEKVRQSFRKKE
jgi:PTS system beta-glucoside-specific IIA component, Glc family (TC 4.A.1.2.5)/PTS system beta-glucoside-specific IIB component, Glc family (TC 4.A.1.2.5)/PTS system beta-glucoside-specific IIC component, Glc family (TC 4.A.1.2.5)